MVKKAEPRASTAHCRVLSGVIVCSAMYLISLGWICRHSAVVDSLAGSVVLNAGPVCCRSVALVCESYCGCYCSFLDEVGTSCEAASEYLALYKKLFAKDHWKYYLAVKGVPVRIAGLITKVSVCCHLLVM